MLYCGVCDLCGFLLINEDILTFKQAIATHFDKSHGTKFGAFVSHVPLKEFEEMFIWRIRDKQQILQIKESMNNPRFWHKNRNAIIPAFAEANRNALALARA